MSAPNSATQITGDKQRAERASRAMCSVKAATMVLHLINEGWTLQVTREGYSLTPPKVQR